MLAYICYCYEVFTYPKLMNQNDRDFQKVLQALTTFDKKLSNVETVVDKLAKATTDYATSQQDLNKKPRIVNNRSDAGVFEIQD